jgi:cytidylate kinase
MIIAIDGPAASGKGTLAKRIAEHYGFHHLDTGLLYRGVARAMLDLGQSLQDEETATAIARALDFSKLDEARLRGAEAGEAASVISVYAGVRQALLEGQRAFAKKAPGAVLDGRDIGTVICPDADAKLFITASPEERAKRRFLELSGNGAQITFDEVLADIKKRDERDQNRASAPLKMADDAALLDTTKLDRETAFLAALKLVEHRIGKRA